MIIYIADMTLSKVRKLCKDLPGYSDCVRDERRDNVILVHTTHHHRYYGIMDIHKVIKDAGGTIIDDLSKYPLKSKGLDKTNKFRFPVDKKWWYY